MGRGSRPKRRWAADRRRKKKEREQRKAPAPPTTSRRELARLPRRAGRARCARCSATSSSASTSPARARSAATSTVAATSTSRSSPGRRSSGRRRMSSWRRCGTRRFRAPPAGSSSSSTREGSPTPELNLNTGERMHFLATFEPGEDSPHWFVLDRAILGQRGRRAHRPAARGGRSRPPSEHEILEALAVGPAVVPRPAGGATRRRGAERRALARLPGDGPLGVEGRGGRAAARRGQLFCREPENAAARPRPMNTVPET